MTEKICRLCLQTISKNYQTIVGELMLKTLKLNLNMSTETVMCAECAGYLQVFSNIKAARVYVMDRQSPLPDFENNVNLDSIEVETTSTLKLSMGTQMKCRFCAKMGGEGSVSLNRSKKYESLVNVLTKHIPEMNLNNTEELLVCETCLEVLQGVLSFILKCLEVEEKIHLYTEMKGRNGKGQIELKDVQQFVNKSESKFEMKSLDVSELEEICDQTQKECAVTAEAEIKHEKDVDNPEILIQSEYVDIKLERGDGESFQEHIFNNEIPNDPLEISVVTPEMEHKKYMNQCKSIHKSALELTVFDCESCSYTTKCKDRLKRHLLTHKSASEVKMYKCELCSHQTKYKFCLKRHLLTHESPSDINLFQCEICSYKTKYKYDFKKHVLAHKIPSAIKIFKCEICTYETQHKGTLKRHLFTHKNMSETKMFRCELCSHQTKYKHILKRHLMTHESPSKINLFKCEMCSFKTKYSYDLKKHLLAHKIPSEIKMFKCDICSYETKHKGTLERHLFTHKNTAEIKLYQCELCSYKTNYRFNLKKHLLTHKISTEIEMIKCEMSPYEETIKEILTDTF